MNYRYIVLVECDSGHEAHATQQAALSEMGMKSRLLQGAVRLFVSRDTPTLPIPGHGAIIGHVFTREGQPVTEALAFMQCRDYAELEKHLLENCWGDYILIHSSGASGRPLNILRDPSGGLPCVYSFQGSNGFITSSISIAIRLNLCRRQVDWAYISHGLTFPYLRTARTGLSEISELLPGCSLNLHGAVAVVRLAWSPWTFVAAGQRYGSPEEAAANVRQAVASTVRALAELDGDILLELSGGLDSSIVAACLRDVDVRVTCCTVVTPLPGEDEQHYAKQMTDHLGTDLHSLNVSSKDAHFHFTPSPDAVAPGMGILHQTSYELLSAAGNTHRVNSFFSGAGGDSVFGYLRGVAPAVDAYRERGLAAGFTALHNLSSLHQCTLWKAAQLTLKKLINPSKALWKKDCSLLDPAKAVDMLESHPWFDAPASALLGDRQKIFDLIVTQSYRDGTPRGTAKHVRIPLLSQPVMEACLRVPTWMCVSEGKNRSVARAAFADAIPHDVLNRRSKGSYLNFAGVVYKENRVQLRGFLMSGCLRSQGLLDVTALEEFFQRDFPPRDFSFLRIFYLCMFENWLRHQD